MAHKTDSKCVNYTIKITQRQDKKMKFYSEILNINKSFFGFLGTENILKILDEMYSDSNKNKNEFVDAIKNPKWNKAGGFKFAPLVTGLPLDEALQLRIILESSKQNGK